MKCLILLGFLALLTTTPVFAVPFVNHDFGFSLEYPAELIVKECPYPACALRLESVSGYPTFNVVAAPGALEISQKRADFIQSQILEDYAKLGLVDVTVQNRSVLEQTAISRILVFTLAYRSEGKNYVSQIGVTSGPDSHFFLTFTAEAPNFLQNKALGDAIRKSFRLTAATGTAPPFTRNWGLWTAGLLFLGLILIGIKRAWHR